MRSATSRAFISRHSRKATSAISAQYGQAFTISIVSNGTSVRPFADDVGQRDDGVIEVTACEFAERVRAAAGVEHVGHQQQVVEGRELDVVAGKHKDVGLHVVADLEHAGVFEQRLELRQRVAFGDLPRGAAAAGQEIVRRAMAERNIGSFVRRQRERDADDLGDHRIGRGRDDVDRDHAFVSCLGDPDVERR